MRNIFVAATAAALLACSTSVLAAQKKAAPTKDVAAAPAKLYDFKGVPLETALDEFRKLPHPDSTAARTVCTGEKVGTSYASEPVDVMLFDDVEKSLGVVKCIWVGTGGDMFMSDRIAGLRIVDSGYATNSYSYSFIRDPKDGVMRLFKFEGQTNIAAFDDAVEALTGKYGKPKVSTDTVHNKLGTAFEQTTATWTNSLASLVAQTRWSKTDDMGFLLLDSRLNALVEAAREAKKKSIANPI